MPRDKSSKRRERKMLDYKGRPYKNSLASASFILNPDFARAGALTLHDDDGVIGEYDRAIRKAFDAFALDPKQPDHWRELLGILADILFGERGKGPKQRWNSENTKQLISDFDNLSSNYPAASQMVLFEVLIHTKKRRYAGLKAGTLKARYNEEKRRLGMTRRGRRAKV
jgi:hypothetical protein